MTDRDDKSDTGRKKTLATASSHPDPRLVAMVRMLARRAAERDFDELLRQHGMTRRSPNRKGPPT